MITVCQDKKRRERVLQTPGWNGIDFVEVLGTPGCGNILAVTFVKSVVGESFESVNFKVSGETPLKILYLWPATIEDPLTIEVHLDGTGNFSPYTLSLVTGPENADPPNGIDPQLASLEFSFKAGCPAPTDCLDNTCCPDEAVQTPDINYLARDYEGFRQAMLDRLAVLVPDWGERHVADPGISLVESLAYAADRLSYLQDAVNTEAYLGTARSRISMRRHARLVDYTVDEGANARTWVCLTASIDRAVVPVFTQFYPQVPGLDTEVERNSYQASLLDASGSVFENIVSATLHVEQNQMDFYTWGDGQCCLPKGATQATLNGAFLSLMVGQVLIFEEVLGPRSGKSADADPNHRWAVRLTKVSTSNLSGQSLVDPLNGGQLLTEIGWHSDDALPFSLCISTVTDSKHGTMPLSGVSVARGNVVAVEHGSWHGSREEGEELGVVPAVSVTALTVGCSCVGVAGAAVAKSRFAPQLPRPFLTHGMTYYDTVDSASSLLAPTGRFLPQIWLESSDGVLWYPVADLLESGPEDNMFVPELESDGTVRLRFGDGTYGALPEPGLKFSAHYRTGNGTSGNVGRDTVRHILANNLGVVAVRNPLAAAGGRDPETMEHIRQHAPFQFQSQKRCVTADDYSVMAGKQPGVREAKGTLRWTGSWYAAHVSIDPQNDWTDALSEQVGTELDLLRMLGTDVVVENAVLVGLRIGLSVCVQPAFFQGDVYDAIWQKMVTGDACQGTFGLLNAANFRFGQTVYLSPIVAMVQSVAGVASVRVTAFERVDRPRSSSGPPMQLTMGALEIPRCDNDFNRGDRGVLVLTMDGGK